MRHLLDDQGNPRARSAWLEWAPVIVALLHAATLFDVGPVDDDYIVYRYARHWVEGLGPVFNPGEVPVDGVTSPGWFLLAALGLWGGASPAVWTPLVGASSFALLVFVVGRWARARDRSRFAELAPWAVAVSPAVAWHAVAGLGTMPLAAAIALGFHRWARWAAGEAQGVALPGLAFAVACTLRVEALVPWAACVVAMRPARRLGMIEVWWMASPLLALLVLSGLRWEWFGSLTPHALGLKALPLAVELEYGARYLVRSLSEGGLSLMLLLAVLVPRTDPEGRAISLAALGSLVAVLGVGGDWMVYSRFLVPFVGVGAVGAVGVVAGLGRGRLRVLPAVAAAGLVVALPGAGLAARPQAVFEQRFFEQHWLRMGAAFGELAPPGSAVGVSPIGAFGWASRLPVVDILGLTHAAFLEQPPDLGGVKVKGHHRHDGGWVLDQAPDYLILGNGVIQPQTGTLDANPWEADILADPRFHRMYRPLSLVLEEGGGEAVVPYFARAGVRAVR